MNENLRQLTDKIYQEGIERAEAESRKIIDKAKAEAQQIIHQAEQKAAGLIQDAEKTCSDLTRKNESEMRLASRQALSALKQKITDLLIWEVTSGPVRNAFEDQEFVQHIISRLIENWQASFGQEERLRVLLPEQDFEALQDFFQTKAQGILGKGVNIMASSQMKNGFQISPEDGRFKVNFTAEDFENYFKTYARPRAYKLLFGDEN